MTTKLEDEPQTLIDGTHRPKAVIAGGGLAGIACAKRLTDTGFAVELVEAEDQFGGRTASWIDHDGQPIESGVHTFFGVYSHLIRLLNEVGVDIDNNLVSWDDKVGFLQPGAQLNIFAIDALRDLPGVLGGVLGNNNLLGPLDKITTGFTILNGLLRREDYEARTVYQLVRDGGVDHNTYERIFRPLARGLAFCEPEELSAYVLLTLLTHGITNPLNLRAGTFRGGMTRIMINPIIDWLNQHGVALHTNSPVQAIRYQQGRIAGFELKDGRVLTGDVYVSALPLEIFKPLMPPVLTEMPYFAKIQQIETVPAIAVQVWFDRKFMHRDEFIFLSGSPLVVFQDESKLTFPYPGCRISGQITARYTDNYSDQQYIDLFLEEFRRYVPSSRAAQVKKALIVRHQAFAMKPGTQALRPQQGSPVPNFVLAGDYTRQDWFTTMEGATRSGEMAAQAIRQRVAYQATS